MNNSDIEFARMWMFGRGVTVVRKPEFATGKRSWFLNGVLPDNMKDLYGTRWTETYGCTTIEGYESELDAVTHIARRLKSFKDSLSYCNN